jgi:hypothetical protein
MFGMVAHIVNTRAFAPNPIKNIGFFAPRHRPQAAIARGEKTQKAKP